MSGTLGAVMSSPPNPPTPPTAPPARRVPGRRVVAAIIALALLVFVIGLLTATRGPEGDAAGDPPDREARPPASGEERAPGLAVPARGIGSPDGTVAAEAPPDRDDDRNAIIGRVVDEAREPVAGASVTLQVEGRVAATTSSGADGTFRLVAAAVGSPPRWVVRAERAEAVAARRVVADPLRVGPAPVGDLVLRAGTTLVVRVTDGGVGAPGVAVAVAFDRPEDSAFSLGPEAVEHLDGWVATGTTDAGGVATFAGLPRGDVHVLALAAGPRRGSTRAALDGAATIEVALSAARDVEIEVVEAAGGRPVAGVRIGVETALEDGRPDRRLADPSEPAPTDANGRTLLRGLPREPLTVTVVGDGWIWPPWRTAVALPTDLTSLRIEVPAATAAAVLPATFADGPPPADGTPVRLEADPREDRGFWGPAGLPVREGRIVDAALRIDGLRNPEVRGSARLPDGRVGRFVVDPHMGDVRPVFARPRTVDVTVAEEDGTPAGAAQVVVVDARGHELARGRTGSDGRWRAMDLPPARVTVTLEAGSDLVEPSRWGSFEDELRAVVDLTSADGAAEFVRPGYVEAELVATTDGKPGLPPGVSVLVGFAPASLAFADPPGARWDVARGVVRFRVRRPTGKRTLVVLARARGYSTAYETFRSDPDTRTLRASAAFSSAASLVVTLSGATGLDAAQFVERRGDDGAWRRVFATVRPGATGHPTTRLEDVPPGAYRLRHGTSGATSPVVAVRGGEEAALELTLAALELVDVSVELPDGADVERLVVHREGAGLEFASEGPYWDLGIVRGMNLLRWTLPGDRPVRLWAEHPACVTTPGEGDVTVTAPGPRVSLRLRAR